MTYKVVSKGNVYWYAYRGGPRIADPSTPEGADQLRQLTDDRAKPYVNTIGNIVNAFCVRRTCHDMRQCCGWSDIRKQNSDQ